MNSTFGWNELSGFIEAGAAILAVTISFYLLIKGNKKRHEELMKKLLDNQKDEFEKEKAIDAKFEDIQKTVTGCQTAHNAQSVEKFHRFERELELEKEQNKATNDKLADAIINLEKEMNTKFDNMSEDLGDLKESLIEILKFLGKPAVLTQASKATKTINRKR